MNNQTQHQVGRLTGRVELDAGLMRYRGLLANQRQAAVRGHASRTQHPSHAVHLGREHRRVASAVVIALFLTVALSVASMGQGATARILYLTSCCNGGVAVSYVGAGFESVSLQATNLTESISESLEVLATAETLDAEAPSYSGENCLGSCRFTR